MKRWRRRVERAASVRAPTPPPPSSPSSLLQTLTDSKSPHPAVAAVLRPDEYAAYVASDKPRQLAAVEVTRRLDALSTARPALTVPAYALLDRGVAASGALTSIKLQALPLAITLTCTGFLLLFLFTYPRAGLAIKKGVGAHDDAMESVWFTLAIQFFQARTRAKRDEGREESARALAKTTTPDAPSPLSPSSPPSQFAVINILLLGADEVANALEEPFVAIPLEAMAMTTARDAARVMAEARAGGLPGGGDRGRGGGVVQAGPWS